MVLRYLVSGFEYRAQDSVDTFWFKIVFHLGTTALLAMASGGGRLASVGAGIASASPVNVSTGFIFFITLEPRVK